MVVLLMARSAAALAGTVLVLAVWASVIRTLIVPRRAGTWVTRWVHPLVIRAFQLATSPIADYRRQDRILAGQAPVILLAQLFAWLGVAFVGYALLLWSVAAGGMARAFTDAGSSLFTLGFFSPAGAAPVVIVLTAAVTGLVIITLQIAYLPTLYSAFNRRETEVTLLNARAGAPSWGPELLMRTHYALGSGVSTLDTMPNLYGQWERWAADVAESHTTYLPLARFRSPGPLSSWVTALLAVLDSAALFLALSPGSAPEVSARLCLRAGYVCFSQVARAMGIDVPEEPDPEGRIGLTYEEFLDAVTQMREVGFPVERDPAEAWPQFVGWRVNYERAAYAVARAVDAVPAQWSGPRRHHAAAIPPDRPSPGSPPDLAPHTGQLADISGAGAAGCLTRTRPGCIRKEVRNGENHGGTC